MMGTNVNRSGTEQSSVLVCNDMLTVSEVAARLRVPPSWVYRHADLLGVYRLGKYLRFNWEQVLARLSAPAIRSPTLGSRPNDVPEQS